MNPSFLTQVRKYAYLIGIMAGLPLLGLLGLGVYSDHHFNTLPYYNQGGSMDEWDESAHRVGAFELTNQYNQPFDSNALKGKVWLAAFYATNAPHVAQMTRQLLWPNFRYRDEEDIAIVCFTLDAEHDSPELLLDYVERNVRYNGAPDKWQFLTGSQDHIDQIIGDSFLIQRDESDPDNIATLWLVDDKGYLRGVYHAASENDIKDAVEDIALLQKEMDEEAYALKKARSAAAELPALPVLGPEGHTVPPFVLLNADSVEFSHRDLEGKIRVVDFFFTRCPTICPIMSSQMARVQEELAQTSWREDVMLLSHSVDPTYDTPHVLKAYAHRIGSHPARWQLLTGPKEDLYDLARNGYFLTALESDTAAGGIFHSDIFALVDPKNQIRGYYDGTSTEEVNQLLQDIRHLWLEK